MQSLYRSLRRFFSGSRSRAGNVAIIFSLAVVPIVGGVGAAVDYSTANSNRASLQKALDATGLALAKLMPLSQTQLDEKGWQIFSANLGVLKVSMPQSGLVITTPTVGKIDLVATGQYTPQIAGFLGVQSFPVKAKTQVQWGMKKLELALALDNTGSMAEDNKMTELKKAAKNLVNLLQVSQMQSGDVKVSIIPFNQFVNVGTSNVLSTWVRWTEWDQENQTCTGPWWARVCVPQLHTNWDGCVMDRDKDPSLNYDTQDTTPNVLQNNTKFPAVQCYGGLVSMLPLTTNYASMTSKIDSMQSVGGTNVTIGLVWAWHSLTPNLPLTEAAAANSDLNKYIILMTDGVNTMNRFWGNGADPCSQCTARMSTTCANVKAAGIKIYTIRVIDGDADALRNCASDPSMYYDVQNASQLTSVFNSIGATLAKLHLAQ